MREKLGLEEYQVLVEFIHILLLLRDQTSYNRIFEEIEGNKSIPGLPLCDF